MNYDQFKAAFLQALRGSGLPTIGDVPSEERLDLRSMDRTVTVYVEPAGDGRAGPFHVSGAVSWRWDALHTARAATTEDDFLTEVLGREGAHRADTVRPWLRIDLELRASLEMGQTLPMPSPAKWASWRRAAFGRLAGSARLVAAAGLRDLASGEPAIPAWQGEPELHGTCDPRGVPRLTALTLSAFQGIALPRAWDPPGRPRDADPDEELATMFARLGAALAAWAATAERLA